MHLALRLFGRSNSDGTTVQYASGNLTPIELLHVPARARASERERERERAL